MNLTDLSKYNISKTIIDKLAQIGIKELTKIQSLAVENGLFEGKNMLISAPTNTGKTLVGELAAINSYIRKRGKKTFFLIPLKAIAEEKFDAFTERYSDTGLKVAISTGERDDFDDSLLGYEIIISTYEKICALLVRNPELYNNIGSVIVDEIQNIGDSHRGIGLEMLLTKLIYNQKEPVQIIGLSATIPNAKQLADWMRAILIETEERVVELREGVLYAGENSINYKGNTLQKGTVLYKEFNSGKIDIEKLDLNTIETLVELCKKEQMIVFTDTRRDAELLANNICQYFPPTSNISKWINDLDNNVESTPLLKKLKKCLINGVAFHHAGMIREEKEIIEKAFQGGDVRLICSTSTLGAGVNTPAKNIVIQKYRSFTGNNISVKNYKNMAGRAGRIKFHDDFGRSILFAMSESELSMLWENYIDAVPEEVISQLKDQEKLKFHIVALFASGTCNDEKALLEFIDSTYFGYSYYRNNTNGFKTNFENNVLKRLLDDLIENGFLIKTHSSIGITELGKRCAETMISPASAHKIYSTLINQKSKINSYVENDGLVEPIIHLVCTLDVAERVYLPNSQQEQRELWIYWETQKSLYLCELDEQVDSDLILTSLRTTQLLLRWIEGISYAELQNFAAQGTIRAIADNISWLVKAIVRFTEKPLTNFSDEVQTQIKEIANRVLFGVPKESIEIMKLRIPAINRRRAINLSSKGLNTLNSLISAPIDYLKTVPEIGDVLATGIKNSVVKFIEDTNRNKLTAQSIRAAKLGRDISLIEKLYNEKGDSFSKVCCEIINGQFKIKCTYIGDIAPHEPDCLIETNDGQITIECKRKDEQNSVTARESEEILGKGAKYRPITNVTIGFPLFSADAINNAVNTKITLLTHSVMAEMLLDYWEGKINQKTIVEIFKSSIHVTPSHWKAFLP